MKPWVLTYKDAKSLVICGDIHGEFVPLVYEMLDIMELLEVPRKANVVINN